MTSTARPATQPRWRTRCRADGSAHDRGRAHRRTVFGSLGSRGAGVTNHPADSDQGVALINPAVRIRSPSRSARRVGPDVPVDHRGPHDRRRTGFVARAADVAAQPPLLLVSGERDHSAVRTDAAALVDALCEQYANPEDVELITVPALSHPWPTNPAGTGRATALGQGGRRDPDAVVPPTAHREMSQGRAPGRQREDRRQTHQECVGRASTPWSSPIIGGPCDGR
jgi:hypothetical protein